MTTEFWLTTLIICLTPGIGVLMTLSAGLTHGRRTAVVTAGGCTLGVAPHLLAAAFGAAAVFAASDVAFAVLKYLGVAYLLWMAWGTLRTHGALSIEGTGPGDTAAGPATDQQIVVRALLANLLNPKLTIFFFAFLPQFVPGGGGSVVVSMLVLGLAFMAVTLVVFVAYGLAAARVRDQVVGRPGVMTWLRRVFAVSFVGLGVRLALAQR